MFSSVSMSKEPCPLLTGLLWPPRQVLNLILLFLPHLLLVCAHPKCQSSEIWNQNHLTNSSKNPGPDPLKNMTLKQQFRFLGAYVVPKTAGCGFKAVWAPAISSLTTAPLPSPDWAPPLCSLFTLGLCTQPCAQHSGPGKPASSLSLSYSHTTVFEHLPAFFFLLFV